MTSNVKFTPQFWRDELDALIDLEKTTRMLKGVDPDNKYVPKAYLLTASLLSLVYSFDDDKRIAHSAAYRINVRGYYGCIRPEDQAKIEVVPFHVALREIHEARDYIVKSVYLNPYEDRQASLVLIKPVILADAAPPTLPRSQQLSQTSASQEGEGSPGSLSDSGTPAGNHPGTDADKT